MGRPKELNLAIILWEINMYYVPKVSSLMASSFNMYYVAKVSSLMASSLFHDGGVSVDKLGTIIKIGRASCRERV